MESFLLTGMNSDIGMPMPALFLLPEIQSSKSQRKAAKELEMFSISMLKTAAPG